MGQQFMRVEEVAEILDVSTSYAYKVIRELNEELKRKGFITISGRVNREYFNERLYQARKENKHLSDVFLFIQMFILLQFYTSLLTDFTIKTYNIGVVKR